MTTRRTTTTTEPSKAELIYVGDPLCSWCWGFAPSLERLREQRADQLDFSILMGGLRTGNEAQPMTPDLARYLQQAWRDVERHSGQPFDHRFLERENFVYDTEPACRAVVTVRELREELAFDYNEALQGAFYRDNRDPTELATFVAVAEELGIAEDDFEQDYRSEAIAEKTQRDFQTTREMGIFGYPTTVLRKGATHHLLAQGFLPPDELDRRVARIVG